jgi:hypothetical protein
VPWWCRSGWHRPHPPCQSHSQSNCGKRSKHLRPLTLQYKALSSSRFWLHHKQFNSLCRNTVKGLTTALHPRAKAPPPSSFLELTIPSRQFAASSHTCSPPRHTAGTELTQIVTSNPTATQTNSARDPPREEKQPPITLSHGPKRVSSCEPS